jgi:hypothetical protein
MYNTHNVENEWHFLLTENHTLILIMPGRYSTTVILLAKKGKQTLQKDRI